MFYKYKKMPVQDLASELEKEAPKIVDVVVDSRELNAMGTGPDGAVLLEVPDILTDACVSMPLNPWAHSQLAQITGIPKKYYDKLLEHERGELLAQNINAWLPTEKRRLVKTVDGTIRAILSDKYKTIDNFNILKCTMEKLLEYRHLGATFQECHLSVTRMYLRIALSGLNGEVRPDDKYHFGVIVTNSEVGAASLRVEPYMCRQVCSNGMIRQTVLKKIHIGAVNIEIASAATRLLQDAALYSEFQDAIEVVLQNGHFAKWLDELTAATEVPISEPTDAVKNLATAFKISEDNQKPIADYFFKEKDVTQYGLIQGVTRAAQDLGDVDEAVRWEGIAGELSSMDAEKFGRVIA